jgi:hypothetical protein
LNLEHGTDVAELLKSQEIAEVLGNGHDILTGTQKKDMKKLGNF